MVPQKQPSEIGLLLLALEWVHHVRQPKTWAEYLIVMDAELAMSFSQGVS